MSNEAPLDLDADDILSKIERAHLMGSAHPGQRNTMYAKAADEIRRLRAKVTSIALDAGFRLGDLASQRDAAIARAEAAEAAVAAGLTLADGWAKEAADATPGNSMVIRSIAATLEAASSRLRAALTREDA